MLDDRGLSLLFGEAFTHYAWSPRPVSDDVLAKIYELARLGPTSANCCPLRIVFVRTAESKERLRSALSKGNVAKTLSAPVVAIMATDRNYVDWVPRLFPAYDARPWFTSSPSAEMEHGFRNATLQAGYFIVAARACGVDCGPISGFDAAKIQETFLAGTTWEANFLINLGYGAQRVPPPRKPRPTLTEACRFS